MSRYLIRRDDGISDGIAGQVFDSYDAAYAVLERYYADICCSDDREYYRIVVAAEETDMASSAANDGQGVAPAPPM
ncbi:hypothetical protein KQ298_05720 [Synechococcus sp. CS-1330]|nr:hypothetical protein [Synechococcus sp. CS-1330]